jgi:hypothetical protein
VLSHTLLLRLALEILKFSRVMTEGFGVSPTLGMKPDQGLPCVAKLFWQERRS